MPGSKLTVEFKRGGRIKESHGGYSYLYRKKLPENRKEVLKYLIAVREGLIKDLGDTEENLTTAQIVLIDRIISKLGCVRVMEEFVRERGVLRGDELQPCLKKNYLAYNNLIRLDLQALGINHRRTETAPTPLELAAQIDQEKKGENS